MRLFRSAAAGAFCGRAWRLWKYIAPACRALLSPALRRNLAFRFSEKDTALWDYPKAVHIIHMMGEEIFMVV